MKKKLFRERRYNMVNGEGTVLKENLTIEDIKKMKVEKEPKNAKLVKIEAVKRGRKNAKSDK